MTIQLAALQRRKNQRVVINIVNGKRKKARKRRRNVKRKRKGIETVIRIEKNQKGNFFFYFQHFILFTILFTENTKKIVMMKRMIKNVIENVNVITVKITIEKKIIRILIVKRKGKKKENGNE